MQRKHHPDPLLRLDQIIGQRGITEQQAARNRAEGKRGRRPRPAVPGYIPMSKSSWFSGMREGRYPQPDIRAPGCNYWRESTIMRLLADLEGHREAA